MATILVVDDHALNRKFLKNLFNYAGHEVLEANDGGEALDIVRAKHPALVIADVLMPTMDGVEFANRLHANALIARTPIIFYTAAFRVNDARTLAQSCGVATVLAKPSEPQVILDAVAAALGLAQSMAPISITAEERADAVARGLPAYRQTTTQLQLRLQKALDRELELIGESDALRHVSTRLARSFGAVQALSLRLTALLELGLELSSERDPRRLLELFCRAARDIVNAKYVAVGILDAEGRRLQSRAAHGLPEEVKWALTTLDARAGVLGEALATNQPRRLHNPDGLTAVGLPASHPPICSLLVVPVRSTAPAEGWIYFAEKLGAERFDDEDEEIAFALAAHLATIHGNLVLHEDIRRRAGELEIEIAERKLSTQQLLESELRFRQLAENIKEVFFLVEISSGELLYVSPAFGEIWGHDHDDLSARPRLWMDAVHPDDHESAGRIFELEATGGRFDVEYRILRPDGSRRWIHARGFPIRDDQGEIYRIAGVAEDITERREQQRKIARLTRIYAVLSGINSAIVRVHERQALLDEACRTAVEAGGFRFAWIGVVEPDATSIKPIARFGVDDGFLDIVRQQLEFGEAMSNAPSIAVRAIKEKKAAISNDVENDLEIGFTREYLERGFRSVVVLPLIVSGHALGALALYASEVDFFSDEEMKLLSELAGDIAFGLQYLEKVEKLNYLAYYDDLTGLPNDALFADRLGQFLSVANGGKKIVAVILIDLDRFTQLNDTLGRQAGDALLKATAERLNTAMRESLLHPFSLARISADTFAVAIAELRHGTEAARIVEEKIFNTLSRPLDIDGRDIRLTARAGIALHPDDGTDAATLFKNAEAALKRAQSLGERYLYYAPQMNAKVAERLTLESKLRTATELKQFVLHYQPKLRSKTRRLTGLEALIRWNDPATGLIAPAAFIPLLEESGLILEVGKWVLDNALADIQRWREKGLRPPPVAVNVSAIQLRQRDFADVVRRAIEESGVDAPALELEITESLIMADIESNYQTLRRIRDLGVKIQVDDFGTGYSSLSHLAQLPVDVLKIDRLFVATMTDDSDSVSIVSTIISLAHSLKLTVVAEGVETEQQAKLLKQMKCDEMQGYLFGKPVPVDEIDALLSRQRKSKSRSLRSNKMDVKSLKAAQEREVI